MGDIVNVPILVSHTSYNNLSNAMAMALIRPNYVRLPSMIYMHMYHISQIYFNNVKSFINTFIPEVCTFVFFVHLRQYDYVL